MSAGIASCDSGQSKSGRYRRHLRRLAVQGELRSVLVDRDTHVSAARQAAKQQLLGKRTLDVLLDRARHGACTHLGIVALAGDPAPGRVVQRYGDALLLEL